MRIISIGAALGAMVVAASAQAGEAWPNWYLGLNGSVSYMQDSDIGGSVNGTAESDIGYAGGVSVGYIPDFAKSATGKARVEAEYRLASNDLDSASIGGTAQSLGGEITTSAIMLNGFYDFALQGSNVTPYVGAGVGLATTDVQTNLSGSAIDSDDNGFAWQLMAGLGYSPESLPFTTWTVGYRYFNTSDATVNNALGAPVEFEADSHHLEAGAQLRF